MNDLLLQLSGERLTLARVLYYMPDHPSLLQEFTWQTLDRVPELPRVHRFLRHWRDGVSAVVHSVTISVAGFVVPVDLNVLRIVGSC